MVDVMRVLLTAYNTGDPMQNQAAVFVGTAVLSAAIESEQYGSSDSTQLCELPSQFSSVVTMMARCIDDAKLDGSPNASNLAAACSRCYRCIPNGESTMLISTSSGTSNSFGGS